ncbi:MAG: 30S ribosomal protein S16 [Candidatus Bipolaricaulota bacterium]
MSARIRMKKTGKKNQPYFRIVVLDRSRSRDTEVLDDIGFYNPRPDPRDIRLDTEKAYEWLKKGAEPSQTVREIFSKEGLMEKLHEERYG